MNYELAKELKGAGFPQHFKCGSWFYSYDGEAMGYIQTVLGNMDDVHEDEGDILLPTLSELIEACGQSFIGIQRTAPERGSLSDRWVTTGGSVQGLQGEVRVMSQISNTPEEAVARLWLALNRKPDRPLNYERE